MTLILDDSHIMLRDSAAGYLRKHGNVAQLRGLRDGDDTHGFEPKLWAGLGEMGFIGILVSEADGGLGLGHVEAGLILEEMGRNLTASPFLSTSIGAVTALSAGVPHLREKWLPRIVASDVVGAIAVDETAAHRPAAVNLKTEQAGENRFRLNGRKTFVHDGHVADLLIVSARDASDRVALFALDRRTRGITASSERLVDSNLYADILFEDVEVDFGCQIAAGEEADKALHQVLDALRLGAAAELVGVASEAFERTLLYLKERRQFGVAIGSFQALQHRMAHLYSELEVARAAVLKAQQLTSTGDSHASTAVAVAKATAEMAATLAVQEAVQLHGGIGMTDEMDIGLFMKRAKVLSSLYGGADFQIERFARLSGF
jgi:alkylation response protein AidB-like acyl-CoA dehydrogenase